VATLRCFGSYSHRARRGAGKVNFSLEPISSRRSAFHDRCRLRRHVGHCRLPGRTRIIDGEAIVRDNATS